MELSSCTSFVTGNLVTVALVAIIGNSLSKANEFFFFAAGCVVAMLLLLWAGSQFVYKQRRSQSFHAPVDETLIVHATDDRAYVGWRRSFDRKSCENKKEETTTATILKFILFVVEIQDTAELSDLEASLLDSFSSSFLVILMSQ